MKVSSIRSASAMSPVIGRGSMRRPCRYLLRFFFDISLPRVLEVRRSLHVERDAHVVPRRLPHEDLLPAAVFALDRQILRVLPREVDLARALDGEDLAARDESLGVRRRLAQAAVQVDVRGGLPPRALADAQEDRRRIAPSRRLL